MSGIDSRGGHAPRRSVVNPRDGIWTETSGAIRSSLAPPSASRSTGGMRKLAGPRRPRRRLSGGVPGGNRRAAESGGDGRGAHRGRPRRCRLAPHLVGRARRLGTGPAALPRAIPDLDLCRDRPGPLIAGDDDRGGCNLPERRDAALTDRQPAPRDHCELLELTDPPGLMIPQARREPDRDEQSTDTQDPEHAGPRGCAERAG